MSEIRRINPELRHQRGLQDVLTDCWKQLHVSRETPYAIGVVMVGPSGEAFTSFHASSAGALALIGGVEVLRRRLLADFEAVASGEST